MNSTALEMIYGRPTKGSLVIGAALLPTPTGSKFVGVALNA